MPGLKTSKYIFQDLKISKIIPRPEKSRIPNKNPVKGLNAFKAIKAFKALKALRLSGPLRP